MIDTFHRIRQLSQAGIKIHLHCFTYGRDGSEDLESLCESVHYYSREMGLFRHLTCKPFIVSSRRSGELKKNLSANSYPVLFDGHHTTFLLDHPDFKARRKFVRVHNVEQDYYSSKARHERNLLRKLYYTLESFRLKRYEKVLSVADAIFPLTESDKLHFEKLNKNVIRIAPFHPFDSVQSRTGTGDYILYHGDLSVNENQETAEMLIRHVFASLDIKCLVAGKKPPAWMKRLVLRYPNVGLIADPAGKEMMGLVQNAHINIIPAAEPDGFKIKLLFALMAGRHCIVNKAMVKGPAIMEGVVIADTPEEMISSVKSLIDKPFTDEMVLDRHRLNTLYFNNRSNVYRMIETMFERIKPGPS